mgnify:FL=1
MSFRNFLIFMGFVFVLGMAVIYGLSKVNPHIKNITTCVKTKKVKVHDTPMAGAVIGYLIFGGLGGALLGGALDSEGDYEEERCVEYKYEINPLWKDWEEKHKN